MNSKFPPVLIFTVILLITVLVRGELEKAFNMTEPVEIMHLKDVSPNEVFKLSDLGLVYGARNCAKSGHVLEIRAEKCRADIPAVCSLTTNERTKIRIVFAPSQNIDDYKVRATVATSDDLSKSVEIPMPGRKLIKGEQYLYSFAVVLSEVLEGKFFTGRAEIIDNLDQQVKVCAEADHYVWPISGKTPA